MKKLLSLLAVAVLFPVAANADVLKDVNLKGEIQTIASDVKHDYGYVRGTSARVLAGLSADLVEDVTANVMFQYANIWGGDDAAGRTVQNYSDTVRVVEANVVLHNLFCCLEATVGRQFYGDEDSAVMYIGPNHYNAERNGYVGAIDAAKITYSDDVKSFTVIAGKVNDTMYYRNGRTGWADPTPIPPTVLEEESQDMFGADFRMNITDTLNAQVYGYDFHDSDYVNNQHRGFYGAKVKWDSPVRLAAEYARNFGGHRLVKEHKSTGHMLKVDAAADVEEVTVRGTFYYANDTFFAWGNYTPGLLIGHRSGGHISNVALFNVGVDVKPFEKWTVSVDGYSFQDHRMKHAATYETDVTAKYAHNENVELFAGVGYADYAKVLSDNIKGQLGMLIKF